ncbi:MAG: hypothetical protein GDA36_10780 [Rhodobacteraceae bacterium]|nr:hypothetical protein [Paracoccaceae bacterium]
MGCFIRVFNAGTAANERCIPHDPKRAWPIRIQRIIRTDNGKAFTDRLFGLGKRAATGAHEFDRFGIDHRLIPSKSPRTNGMAEREGGRIG